MPMNLPTILTGAAVTAAVGTAAYMMTGKKKKYRQAAQEKSRQSGAGCRGHRGEYFQHHGLM